MKRSLRYDSEALELRLVMDDLWDDQHGHSEYRVPNTARAKDFDGKEVRWEPALARHYVQMGDDWVGQRAYLDTDNSPPVVCTKTPCPRLASKSGRAK
jgi:hypothetical protein